MNRSSDHHATRCRQMAKILIPAIREVARAHGYALGVHGSLSYDIDLIACPWRDMASPPESLAERVGEVVKAVCGCLGESSKPEKKPHGRLAWVFHIGGGPYVDLSVFPPTQAEVSP